MGEVSGARWLSKQEQQGMQPLWRKVLKAILDTGCQMRARNDRVMARKRSLLPSQDSTQKRQ